MFDEEFVLPTIKVVGIGEECSDILEAIKKNEIENLEILSEIDNVYSDLLLVVSDIEKNEEKVLSFLDKSKENCGIIIGIDLGKTTNYKEHFDIVLGSFENFENNIVDLAKVIDSLLLNLGLVNVEFGDLRSIIEKSEICYIGRGISNEEDRASKSAMSAINNLSKDLKESDSVVLSIRGGESLGLLEINQSAMLVQENCKEDVEIIFGATIDQKLEENLEVIIMAFK